MRNHASDHVFLRRAIELSKLSLHAGGFPDAAVLVRNNEVIAHGVSCTETEHDVTAHGAIQAIRAAGVEAVGPLTMYTPLEPCLMCLAAGVCAGVERIVFACRRTEVDKAYYVNSVDAADASKLLAAPPQSAFVDVFEEEVLALIKEYENRMKIQPEK